ncbi:hypothetical protein WDC_1511 [Paucilactobacillus wasatchensis]|uniref:Uncharacterized protein n=1 Tax=Paucilactobacillus wasatchensis TaxID=1335616 RepID=A0A0D1A4W2_9LACO|nr:hypothetical protein WDC_1511 [Paucilactobacillus wasatchensis]
MSKNVIFAQPHLSSEKYLQMAQLQFLLSAWRHGKKQI